MEQEEWKTVIYQDVIYNDYEVSSHGRVRRLNYRGTGKIKMLKLQNEKGYLKVRLHQNNTSKNAKVHRMVAIAFVPNDNPTVKTEVHHKDHNKHNNHKDNLEWIDSDTHKRDEETGKLIGEQQKKRVRCLETGQIFESIKDVSEFLGVSHTNIVNCCKGKQKTCRGYHWEYVE